MSEKERELSEGERERRRKDRCAPSQFLLQSFSPHAYPFSLPRTQSSLPHLLAARPSLPRLRRQKNGGNEEWARRCWRDEAGRRREGAGLELAEADRGAEGGRGGERAKGAGNQKEWAAPAPVLGPVAPTDYRLPPLRWHPAEALSRSVARSQTRGCLTLPTPRTRRNGTRRREHIDSRSLCRLHPTLYTFGCPSSSTASPGRFLIPSPSWAIWLDPTVFAVPGSGWRRMARAQLWVLWAHTAPHAGVMPKVPYGANVVTDRQSGPHFHCTPGGGGSCLRIRGNKQDGR